MKSILERFREYLIVIFSEQSVFDHLLVLPYDGSTAAVDTGSYRRMILRGHSL